MVNKGGHLGSFLGELARNGPWELLRTMPRPNFSGRAAQLVACYAAFEALLLVFMPGKRFVGPVTAGGNRPVYKVRRARSGGGEREATRETLLRTRPPPAALSPPPVQANGFQCFLATFVAYFAALRCAPPGRAAHALAQPCPALAGWTCSAPARCTTSSLR